MLALSVLSVASALPPGYEDVAWCPKGSCLRAVPNPDGFVGPRSAFVECWDPDAFFSPVDEIWTGAEVEVELPHDWVKAPDCPDAPTPPPPPAPPMPPKPPSPPPAPPIPPPLYVCLLHAGTFSHKLQIFATVRLETEGKKHCLVGGATGGLGSGQSVADAFFPTVPENAMFERDRHQHSCCLFDGETLAFSGAERVRVDVWDYDTFNENDYLGGSFFGIEKFAYLKHPPTEEEGPSEEDDEEQEAEGEEQEAEGEEQEAKEEYPMTYSYDGPWHHPQPQTLTAFVGSANPSETSDFAITIKLTRELPADCGIANKWGDPQRLLESGKLDGAKPILPAFLEDEMSGAARGSSFEAVRHFGVILVGAAMFAVTMAAVTRAVRRRRVGEPML